MSKNVLLFGAGASFGSDNYGTPPLGNNLFSELRKFNPKGWSELPKEFVDLFANDFEQGMIKLATLRPHDISILQRAMASYFFTFHPRTSNLYFKLANKLKQYPKQLAISTLNYERLLEISFLSAGFKLMIGQVKEDEIEFNLPQGCCHLFCESVRSESSAVSLSGLNVAINGEIKIISDTIEFNYRIINDAIPPVMSYYEPEKRSTAGQEFLNEQRNRLNTLISNAERIIIVGVKIREHDTHIWEVIKNTSARFVYCSGKGEKKSYDLWVNNHRSNKENVFINGFWSDKFDDVFNELV